MYQWTLVVSLLPSTKPTTAPIFPLGWCKIKVIYPTINLLGKQYSEVSGFNLRFNLLYFAYIFVECFEIKELIL